MPISIVTPQNWSFGPPLGHRSHPSINIQPENPHLRILLSEPHSYTGPHSHSEPEVMVVLKGRMFFNGQWCGEGSVVYVPADEDYWHATGAEECVVALMRPVNGGVARRAQQAVAAE